MVYEFRNPIGFVRKRHESYVLGMEHLKKMPTRSSANQAIVDALKGPNKTTIQEIRNELHAINQQLQLLVKQKQQDDDTGA